MTSRDWLKIGQVVSEIQLPIHSLLRQHSNRFAVNIFIYTRGVRDKWLDLELPPLSCYSYLLSPAKVICYMLLWLPDICCIKYLLFVSIVTCYLLVTEVGPHCLGCTESNWTWRHWCTQSRDPYTIQHLWLSNCTKVCFCQTLFSKHII